MNLQFFPQFLLVLLSVWRYRPLRRTVNVFVASLAACDLIQTLAVRTLHVQTYVAGYWTLGTRTCVYALVVGNLVILEDMSVGDWTWEISVILEKRPEEK